MIHLFLPDEKYNSVKDIDYQAFYDDGYNALLFDIDNTLVKDNGKLSDDIVQFISDLKSKGFKICLVSNNNEYRVRLFAEGLQIPYIPNAKKPFKKGYLNAMKTLESDETTTCMIGDQLLTDIYGANRLGIYTVHVTPISKEEPFLVKLKRIPEKMLITHYYSLQKKRLRKI